MRSETKADVNFSFAVATVGQRTIVTEEEILLLLTFLECKWRHRVCISNTIIHFNLGRQWFLEYSATIHLDFRYLLIAQSGGNC